jgi:hypothetical protein
VLTKLFPRYEDAAFTYFHLKLSKTLNKAGGFISQIDSYGITRAVCSVLRITWFLDFDHHPAF